MYSRMWRYEGPFYFDTRTRRVYVLVCRVSKGRVLCLNQEGPDLVNTYTGCLCPGLLAPENLLLKSTSLSHLQDALFRSDGGPSRGPSTAAPSASDPRPCGPGRPTCRRTSSLRTGPVEHPRRMVSRESWGPLRV